MADKQVEFWFDLGSPAAYLAWTQLPRLAQECGASVAYKPFLLDGVFQATGNRSPMEVPAKGKYMQGDLERFASFLGSGQSGEYAASLKDGTFVWELPVPNGGTVRYSIRIEQDAWAESGHYSTDGKQWHETFGMNLKRVRPSGACLNEP